MEILILMKDYTYINKNISKLLEALSPSSFITPSTFFVNSLEDLKLQAASNKILHTKLWDQDFYSFCDLELNSDNESIIKGTHYYFSDDSDIFINALFSLMQGRSIEIIDKISAKEYDNYLRLDRTKPAFTHYPTQLYDLLAITEKIKGELTGKKVTKQRVFESSLHGDFDLLSLSEKYELAEEIISELMTKVLADATEKIEIIEIEGSKFSFDFSKISATQIEHILELVRDEFSEKITLLYKI